MVLSSTDLPASFSPHSTDRCSQVDLQQSQEVPSGSNERVPEISSGLSTWFDQQVAEVRHPDLAIEYQNAAAMSRIAAATGAPMTQSIEPLDQAFLFFKASGRFEAYKRDLLNDIETLKSLFADDDRAAIVTDGLDLMLSRCLITVDEHREHFGVDRKQFIEEVFSRLQIMAKLARAIPVASLPGLNPEEAVGVLCGSVAAVSAEAQSCGPGIVKKTADEFALLQTGLFPKDLKSAVTNRRCQLAQKVVQQFVTSVISPDPIVEPHHVVACLNRVSQDQPQFRFLEQIPDRYAQVLMDSSFDEVNMHYLRKQVFYGAGNVSACYSLAVDMLSQLRSQLGEKSQALDENYTALQKWVTQQNLKYPGLGLIPSDVIDVQDLGVNEYRTVIAEDANRLCLALYRFVGGPRAFDFDESVRFEGVAFRASYEGLWRESPGPLGKQFDFSPGEGLEGFDLNMNSPEGLDRVVQLLPVIGRQLFLGSEPERARLLAQMTETEISTVQEQFNLNSPMLVSHSTQLVAALIHANPLLAEHPNGKIRLDQQFMGVSKLFGDQQLHHFLDRLVRSHELRYALVDQLLDNATVITNEAEFSNLLACNKNPTLMFRAALLLRDKFGQSNNSSFAAQRQWNAFISREKIRASQAGFMAAYVALKAAKNHGGIHSDEFERAPISPRRLNSVLNASQPEVFRFALDHGQSIDSEVGVGGSGFFGREEVIGLTEAAYRLGDAERFEAILDHPGFHPLTLAVPLPSHQNLSVMDLVLRNGPRPLLDSIMSRNLIERVSAQLLHVALLVVMGEQPGALVDVLEAISVDEHA